MLPQQADVPADAGVRLVGRIFGLLLALGAALVLACVFILPDQIAPWLERRLADETGLKWRIGKAALTADLSLDLTDVATTDPGARDGDALLTIRSLKLSGPPALLLGGAGEIRASARGLAARLPPDGVKTMPATRSSATADRISSLKASLQNASFAAGGASGPVSVTADAADTSISVVGAPPTRRHADIDIDGSDSHMRISADQAMTKGAPAPVIAVTFQREPAAANAQRMSASGALSFDDQRIRMDDVKGTLGGGNFSGRVGIERGAIPALTWDIRLDRFAIVDDLDSQGAPMDVAVSGPNVRASTLKTIDLAWLDKVQADGTTRIDDLRLGAARAAGISAKAGVKAGLLDIATTAERFYDGGARSRYVLTRGPDGAPLHQLSLSVTRARIVNLLSDLAGVRGIDGATTVHVDVQASGDAPADLLKKATGSGDIAITDGTLDGLDLVQTIGLNPGGAGQAAAGLLKTRFSRLTATFKIAGGQAATDDIQFDMPVINTSGTGVIDAINRTIDFRLHPVLADSAGKPGRLDIPVRVAGPWDAPAVSTDLNNVLANPGAAMQTLQDLGGALSKGGAFDKGGILDKGGLGGGLGGILDSFMPKGAPGGRR